MVILAVGISDKKAQQATINKILYNIDKYQDFIINKLNEIDKN